MRWLAVCDPCIWNELKGCFIISLSYWINLSKMKKRAQPEPGFYNREQNVKLERKRRPQHQREVLPDLYTVERIVAKRKVGHSSEYLVQWQDYPADQRRWEPESHLPEAALTLFESPPMPPSEWVIKAWERIAIVLEKGLKTFRETDATLQLSHGVLRHLFPRLPSELSSVPFKATKEDFATAGVSDYVERIVTVTGGKIDCEQSLFSLLSSSSRRKTSRKPARGILSCFSLPRIPRAGFRDVFPRLDELKRKNRDCSQSRGKRDYRLSSQSQTTSRHGARVQNSWSQPSHGEESWKSKDHLHEELLICQMSNKNGSFRSHQI